MFKSKYLFLIIGGLAVLAIGTALIFPTIAKAQSDQTATSESPWFGKKGGNGFGFGPAPDDPYLAQALGISKEDLQAAKDAAWQKIIDQALEQGLITQSQADAMKDNSSGKGLRYRGLFQWILEGGVDYNAALADELGITVDELNAARQKAMELRLADAVADGDITQEQADLMKAQQAVKSYIDHDALLANALGITVDELQAARENKKGLSQLMDDLGLSREDVQEKYLNGYREAVQKAVSDGVITQEQADLLIQHVQDNGLRFGGKGFGFGRHGFGMGPRCKPGNSSQDSGI